LSPERQQRRQDDAAKARHFEAVSVLLNELLDFTITLGQ
jgi:hypothetical protein